LTAVKSAEVRGARFFIQKTLASMSKQWCKPRG